MSEQEIKVNAGLLKQAMSHLESIHTKSTAEPTSGWIRIKEMDIAGKDGKTTPVLIFSIASSRSKGMFGIPLTVGGKCDIVMEFSRLHSYANGLKDETSVSIDTSQKNCIEFTGEGVYRFEPMDFPLEIDIPKEDFVKHARVSGKVLSALINSTKLFTGTDSTYWSKSIHLVMNPEEDTITTKVQSNKVGGKFVTHVEEGLIEKKIDCILPADVLSRLKIKSGDISVLASEDGKLIGIQYKVDKLAGKIAMDTDNYDDAEEDLVEGIIKYEYPYHVTFKLDEFQRMIERFQSYQESVVKVEVAGGKAKCRVRDSERADAEHTLSVEHMGEFPMDIPKPIIEQVMKLATDIEGENFTLEIDEQIYYAKLNVKKGDITSTVIFSIEGHE